ncbi:hypothetical protein [Undibacterium sp. TS12]|uniref:hypothetical protein n=1 Tax=Undibacterium sp. TS12 TaxID=2908202 RepID=UPI001F4CC938|nr:hypothetical protein [Undibacterium sp. TS12]MCH8621943.1 hypothetical protein [Undibacterium sp. TS12]
MATADGQEIVITQWINNLTEEKTVQLSNGILFKSSYDICKNCTTNYMLSTDNEILTLQEISTPGNHTARSIERLDELLAIPDEIENIRDRALQDSAGEIPSSTTEFEQTH